MHTRRMSAWRIKKPVKGTIEFKVLERNRDKRQFHHMVLAPSDQTWYAIFRECIALIVWNCRWNGNAEFEIVLVAVREPGYDGDGNQQNGVCRLNHALTAAQKQMLKAFGRSDACVRTRRKKSA